MIDPVAFYIGVFPVKWYGIMMFLGLVFGFVLWRYLAKKHGMDNITLLELYLFMLLGLFIGCRLFHVIVYNPSYFLANPLKIFAIWEGGLSSHGGIIGGTLAGYYYCRKKKLDFWKWIDIAIIPICLATVFVRIGNFLNSGVVGRITSAPIGVEFFGYEEKRHPVQLYESAKNFFIFAALFFSRNLNFPKGTLYWGFLFLFSLIRFFTEFFKEYVVFSSGLTMGQWLSLILIIISGTMLYLLFSKKITLGKK